MDIEKETLFLTFVLLIFMKQKMLYNTISV